MEYDFTTTSEYSTLLSRSSSDVSLDPAIGAGIIIAVIVTLIIAYVVNAFLMGKIFKKAGEESWKAWVPIYNTWTLLEVGGQKGWYVLLALIPFVGAIITAVFTFIAQYNIGLKLGKSGAFLLLAIFLPIIWFAILAFDKSTWQGAPAAATPDQPPLPPVTPSGTPADQLAGPTAPTIPDAAPTPPQDNTPITPQNPPTA